MVSMGVTPHPVFLLSKSEVIVIESVIIIEYQPSLAFSSPCNLFFWNNIPMALKYITYGDNNTHEGNITIFVVARKLEVHQSHNYHRIPLA